MTTIKELHKEIAKIKERNRKVEGDKAWETSLFRKILISIFTYLVIVLFFYFASLPNPFVNSIIPAIAFILSTFTFPIFKKKWLKYFYKNR